MDLYYLPHPAPSRTVLMVVKALGLKVNKKVIDFPSGEHLKPEFLKINPQHTVPTLVDNGFALWESRAIIVYLVEKYGGDKKSLYPSDLKTRTIINQRLYFDMDTLYKSYSDYYYPIILRKAKLNPELFKKVKIAVELLNTLLEGQKYAAGNSLTLADFSLIATVSSLVACHFDLSKYPNVDKWYKNTQKVIPGWEDNWKICLAIREHFESELKSK